MNTNDESLDCIEAFYVTYLDAILGMCRFEVSLVNPSVGRYSEEKDSEKCVRTLLPCPVLSKKRQNRRISMTYHILYPAPPVEQRGWYENPVLEVIHSEH